MTVPSPHQRHFCFLLLFAGFSALIFAQEPADNLKSYAAGGMTNTPDINLLYISRTPMYDWWQEKNWPEPGDPVGFIAHIQNKGGVPSGPFSVSFATKDSGDAVVADSLQTLPVRSLDPGEMVLVTNTTAFGSGSWTDGDYILLCQADISNAVNETFYDPGTTRTYTYEHNNELEILTHSLALGFVIEQPTYDWFGRTMLGVRQNVYYETDGTNTVTSAPAQPWRGGTYSYEDWAQRHARQINEYMALAENRYFGAQRYSLPRVALMDVSVIPSNTLVWGNGPYMFTPGLSAKKYLFDLEWGFPSVISPGQPGEGHPMSYWYTTVFPDYSVIEIALIHELGHHMGRHHCDYASMAIPPGINLIIPEYNGTIPAFYPGNRAIMQGIMGYGNPPGNGWSPLSASGFSYQLQFKHNRHVRERFGAQNVGSGRFHEDPHVEPHYWNRYTTSFKDYYDGNHFWQQFEVPDTTIVRLTDLNGDPIPGAAAALYQVAPADPSHIWSYGSIINNSVRFDGQFYAPVSGRYAFSSLSLGNVKIQVDGQNLVRTSDVQTYDNNTLSWSAGGGRSDVFRPSKSPSSFIEAGRIFRHGIYRNFTTVTQGWHDFLVEYDTHDPGGNPFAVMFECVNPGGVPWVTIPTNWLRQSAGAPSGGLRKREFNGQPDTSAVPFDSLPLRSALSNAPLAFTSSGGFMIDNAIDASGTTSPDGEWLVPVKPLSNNPDLSKRPNLSLFRFQYTTINHELTEVFLPLDVTDLNMYYWKYTAPTGTLALTRGMNGYAAQLPPAIPEPLAFLLVLCAGLLSVLKR